MKCYKHYEMDAVSQCNDCSKSLCPQCSDKFDFPICENCNLLRIKNDRALLIKNSVFMIVLFVFGFSLSEGDILAGLMSGYFFAGIPWGWSALNRITPNVFLFLPLNGWIFYFVIKFALSLTIGMFVTPFKIYQIINGLNETAKLEQYTKAA
jgi:hypothetical protein